MLSNVLQLHLDGWAVPAGRGAVNAGVRWRQNAFGSSCLAALGEGHQGGSREVCMYQQLHAVVIGVSRYADPQHDLAYARSDAAFVAEVLHDEFGFGILRALFDEDATRAGLLACFENELQTVGEDDGVVIFFAGHGITARDQYGVDRGWLVPHDGDPARPVRNLSMNAVREEWLPMVPAKHVFLIVDACYGGLALREVRAAPQRVTPDAALLAELTRKDRKIRQVLSAGGKDQRVLDGGLFGRSVFTGHLVQALREADPYQLADQVGALVKERVARDSMDRGHPQTPSFGYVAGGEGTFVFQRRRARAQGVTKPVSGRATASVVIACPACSEPLEAGVDTCPACLTLICTTCHQAVKPHWRQCPNCKNPLSPRKEIEAIDHSAAHHQTLVERHKAALAAVEAARERQSRAVEIEALEHERWRAKLRLDAAEAQRRREKEDRAATETVHHQTLVERHRASLAAVEAARKRQPTVGSVVRTLKGQYGYVNSVAFSPDGARLASGSRDAVCLWDPRSGHHLHTLKGHEHTEVVEAVAFSPDSGLLASASRDGTVGLWDAHSARHVRTLEGHMGVLEAIAFSPDGGVLATDSDGDIQLWDPRSGRHIRTLEDGGVTGIAFSPDGGVLAGGSVDSTICLWDPRSGRRLRTLEGHAGCVSAVAFSPDGSVLASSSDDWMVRLWDARSGRHLRTLEGHTDQVLAVAFSAGGGVLASVSDDETVRLWDPRSGRHLHTLEGCVESVAFSPDGRVLATVWDAYDVRLWAVG
jgi:sugar lactone lactonase YvrE